MSEERLAAIEEKIDRLIGGHEVLRAGHDDLRLGVDGLRAGQDGLRAGQGGLRADVDELRVGQSQLRASLDELRVGHHQMRAGQDDLRSGLNELRIGQDELGRYMRVLHEDLIDRIAGTRENTGPTREEFAEFKETTGQRLDPLEAAVRQHSVEIARLKRKRG